MNKFIKLFNKYFDNNLSYYVEVEESDCTDTITVITIGKTYNSCEHESLNESIYDALALFNIKHLGKIYASSLELGSDKRVYVCFMEYKDIPKEEFGYFKYHNQHSGNHTGYPKMMHTVYQKIMELNLVK